MKIFKPTLIVGALLVGLVLSALWAFDILDKHDKLADIGGDPNLPIQDEDPGNDDPPTGGDEPGEEPNEPPASDPDPNPSPNPNPNPNPNPPNDPPTDGGDDYVTPKEIVYGDRSKKQIIFTFDGGAGIHSADEILTTLAEHNVKGTFFLTGKFAESNPALIKRMSAEGHEIFNHTYNHSDLTTISSSQMRTEFRKTEEIIKNLTGKSTKPYFRPPYGARNSTVLDVVGREGYQSIYWTVDALDWKESEGWTNAQTKERIMSNLSNGAIVMMHIGDNITGRILDEVFTEIKARGYSIVPLSQGL